MAVKSFDEKRFDAIVTVHIGRRSDLLKIPGIEPHMFPESGRKRKCPSVHEKIRQRDPGWFATMTQPGGRWRITVHKDKVGRPSMEESVEIAAMRDKMLTARRERARETPQPAKTSNLSDQAIDVAEGWMLLPPRMKASICGIINEHLPRLADSPTLRELYDNANQHDQMRYERYIANK